VIHPRFQGATSLGPRGDALAAFDWCAGRLVEALKANNENNISILSSDNGPVLFDGYRVVPRRGISNHGCKWILRVGSRLTRCDALQ
jgi:arylsulfatase A-like enzyme